MQDILLKCIYQLIFIIIFFRSLPRANSKSFLILLSQGNILKRACLAKCIVFHTEEVVYWGMGERNAFLAITDVID